MKSQFLCSQCKTSSDSARFFNISPLLRKTATWKAQWINVGSSWNGLLLLGITTTLWGASSSVYSRVTLLLQLACLKVTFLLVMAAIALPLLYMILYIYICSIYYIECISRQYYEIGCKPGILETLFKPWHNLILLLIL